MEKNFNNTVSSIDIISEGIAKMARKEITKEEYDEIYKAYCAKRKEEQLRKLNGE